MARIIDRIQGHHQQLSKLQFLLANDRFPQGLLFVGPSGIGKRLVALAVAQSLVCEQSRDACGQCGPCMRIEKQQSESLFNIKPDAEAAKASIKVEQIRELLASLSLAAGWSKRLVIIDEAHLMTDQASNALLKSLEEPDPNTFFILIAHDVRQMLPTIRSRVQVIRFSNLAYEQVRAVKPNLPDWAYRSCRGQVDRLLLLTSKNGTAERQEALDLLEQFCYDEDFLLRDEWRKSLKEDRGWALFNIKCWLQIVRDAMLVNLKNNQHLINTDQTELINKLGEFSYRKLASLSAQLIQAGRDINANQDIVLVFDALRVKYARMD